MLRNDAEAVPCAVTVKPIKLLGEAAGKGRPPLRSAPPSCDDASAGLTAVLGCERRRRGGAPDRRQRRRWRRRPERRRARPGWCAPSQCTSLRSSPADATKRCG